MKKLIASILFFGSFAVAMAQTTPPGGLPSQSAGYGGFWSNLFSRRSVPLIPVVMPLITPIFSTPIQAVISMACPSQQTLNKCPAGTERPNKYYAWIPSGAGSSLCPNAGNQKHKCYSGNSAVKLSNATGVDYEGKEDTAQECIQEVCGVPFSITLTPIGSPVCTDSAPMPYPQCYKDLMSAAGHLDPDFRAICEKEMAYFRRPDSARATQSFTISIRGGAPIFSINGGPGGRQITVSIPTTSPIAGRSLSAPVTVTDSSNPKQTAMASAIIECPWGKPTPSFDCGSIKVAGMSKEDAYLNCNGQSDGLCRVEAGYGPSGSGHDEYYCVSAPRQ